MPRRGPVIITPNHLAEVDSFVLSLVLPRRPAFVAKQEYFTGSGLRGHLERWLCRATGQIPVDRRGGTGAEAALTAAEGILRRGGVWAVYPEGTRSPDGRLYRGHTGAARVAARVPGVAVVPVGIIGTPDVDAAGRRRWRRGRVTVVIGAPLDLTAYDDGASGRRAATDDLMRAIQRLTGQEYVDRYRTPAERAARDAA